jgi:hypothetical protein
MPHQLSCACATIWHAHDAAERTNALYIMLPYHAKHAGLRSFSLAPPLPAQYYLMTVQWALCMNVAQMHAGWGGSSDTGHFVHMNMCRCACIPVPAGPRTSSRTTPITITSSTAACSRKSICRATCGHQAGGGWAPSTAGGCEGVQQCTGHAMRSCLAGKRAQRQQAAASTLGEA